MDMIIFILFIKCVFVLFVLRITLTKRHFVSFICISNMLKKMFEIGLKTLQNMLHFEFSYVINMLWIL